LSEARSFYERPAPDLQSKSNEVRPKGATCSYFAGQNLAMLCPLSCMYYIYILKSKKDGRTCVGYTNNLEERLKKHNSGQVKSTKYRQPLKLLFSEEF